MTFDQGDVVPLGITVTNASGVAENATAVVCTIYLPDGTTATPSVTAADSGIYNVDYTPTLVGRYQVKWVATGTNASAFADEFTVRDFTDMGIVSLDEVKAHLNIPTTVTTQDEELRRFMDAAGDLAENYVGLVLGRRTFTETYNGNGGGYIILRNPSAISVTSVVENSVTLVAGTDFFLDPNGQRLVRIGTSGMYWTNTTGNWSPGIQNVVVNYVAGFTNPPAATRQGVLEIIRHLWHTQRGSMAVLNKGTADEYYPASTYSLPRRAMELLDPASLPSLY